MGEEMGKIFMRISRIFLIGKLAKYRGIEGRKVARAMVMQLTGNQGLEILESEAIQKMAGKN